jgi:hypothetical protein
VSAIEGVGEIPGFSTGNLEGLPRGAPESGPEIGEEADETLCIASLRGPVGKPVGGVIAIN